MKIQFDLGLRHLIYMGIAIILVGTLFFSTDISTRITDILLSNYRTQQTEYLEKIDALEKQNQTLQTQLNAVNKRLSQKPQTFYGDKHELVKAFNSLGYSAKLANCE